MELSTAEESVDSGVSSVSALDDSLWDAMPLKDISFEGIPNDITEEDQMALRLLLQEHREVFALDNDAPGITTMPGFHARIDLIDETQAVVCKGKRIYNIIKKGSFVKQLRNIFVPV